MLTLRESATARRIENQRATEKVTPPAKFALWFVILVCCTLIWAAAIHWLLGLLP